MEQYVEFEVSLARIKPKVWRRFLLKADASFEDLHKAIQRAFGWNDAHPWLFSRNGKDGAPIAGPNGVLDRRTPQAEFVEITSIFNRNVEDTCRYLYDFGDSWEHKVTGRRREEPELNVRRVLLAGERAAPPENCGGVAGYRACCALLATGRKLDDDSRALRARLGAWRPETFNLDAARRRFDLA
jgi:hypothetical protein